MKRSIESSGAKASRRGVTLTELCIVMTIVALMTTMVVSFSAVVGNRATYGANVNNVIEELTYTKQLVTHWISYYDSPDYTFSINEGELSARPVSNPEQVYSIASTTHYAGDGYEIIGQYPDGRQGSARVRLIETIAFSEIAATDEDALLRCTVYYVIPSVNRGMPDVRDEFTFAVCLRNPLSAG